MITIERKYRVCSSTATNYKQTDDHIMANNQMLPWDRNFYGSLEPF